MTASKFIINSLLLTLFLVVLCICDLCYGSVNLFSLESSDSLFSTILYDIRLPKMLTCIIAGSGLAISGLLLQSLFRNPLAGPYVLGISSGSSLFVALATILFTSINVSGFYFFGKSVIVLFSIAGAFMVTFIILMIARKTKSNITILLIGLMLSQILGALQSLIEFMGSADSLKNFILWGMGSVGSTTIQDVLFILPFFIIAISCCFFLVKPLNAILLNEQYAKNLGVNINSLRLSVILITAVLVGIITAFCGPIAFVGISVPIASRLFFKTSHHLHQLVFCLLLGACTVLCADVICQVASSQMTLPINTVTTMMGSPVVIYLLFKSKQRLS